MKIKHENPLSKFPRLDPEIPLTVSSEVLTNPTAKNSATFRKTMLRSRDRVIEVPRKSPKPYAVRVETFAKSRNARQLAKCLSRYPRRHTVLEAKLAGLNLIENPNFIVLQKRGACEMAILDLNHHIVACELEAANRRIQKSR